MLVAVCACVLARWGEGARPPQVASEATPTAIALAVVERPAHPTATTPAREIALAPAPRAVRPKATAPKSKPAPALEPELRDVKAVRAKFDEIGSPRCGLAALALVPDVDNLVAMGEIVFPIYELVLADPKSTAGEIEGVCWILSKLKTDRRQFIPLLVRRLTATDALMPGDPFPVGKDAEFQAARLERNRRWVKEAVISLLTEIGDERDASVLVPLLHQSDQDLQRSAVSAIVKIGGKPELDAMRAWLALQNPDDPFSVWVRDCCEHLLTRLEQPP